MPNTIPMFSSLRLRVIVGKCIAFSVLSINASCAATLSLNFNDFQDDGVPVTSDPQPVIDVKRMSMVFDNLTGEYDIVWYAFPSNPFVGNFRINVLLFNVDADHTGGPLPPDDGIPQEPGFFLDIANNFTLTAPQPTVTLSGASLVLTRWNRQNRVAANGGSFPEKCCFQTSLIARDAPDDPREILGSTIVGDMFIGFDLDIQTVILPEPSSIALVIIGFCSVCFRQHKQANFLM